MKKFKAPAFFSLLMAGTLALSSTAFAAEAAITKVVNVDLVEVSDVHGHLYTENDGVNDYKMAYLAKQFATKENVITLSGGDMFQGTAVSNLLSGAPLIQAMGQMKFDAMALGNHEYDWGVNKVIRTNAKGIPNLYADRKDTGIPVLACNVFEKGTNTLVDYAQSYTIVERSGKKIAIIGAVDNIDFSTAIMPSLVEDIDFKDPAPIINSIAKKLISNKEADAIVVLAHVGGEQDKETKAISGNIANLANELDNTLVSAIFGGHSHQQVTGSVNEIPLTVPYKEARGYTQLRLTFHSNGTVTAGDMEYTDIRDAVHAAKSTDLDRSIVKITDNAMQSVAPVLGKVLAQTPIDLTRNNYVLGESLAGNWSTDATREVAGTDFAFSNDGGLRCDIPKGDVTVGTLYQFMPFDNVLVKVKMTGAQVKTLMEQAVMDGGMGLQISGLTLKYDPNAASMSRVSELNTLDGKAIDPEKVYTVATNEFVGTGGDKFSVFKEPSIAATYEDTHIVLRDALVQKAEEQKTISVTLDGRFVQIGSSVAATPATEVAVATVPATALVPATPVAPALAKAA